MTPFPASPAAPVHRPPAAGRLHRLMASAFGGWLMAVVFVGLPFVAANVAAKLWLDDPGLRDLRNAVKAVVLLAAYAAYVRWWERRSVRELSLAGSVQELVAGLLLGGLLFCCVVAVLAAIGVWSLVAVGSWADFGAAAVELLPKIAMGAVVEEVVFRLLLMRLLERSVGSAWALALSSLLFGLAHLGNAGATPLIGVMLGVELGLLFGAAFLLTRRLWLCGGAHLGWNFAQGGIFSIAVSGNAGSGWLHGTLTGPVWLTGGAFGAEGSVVAVLLCLVATVALLVLRRRNERRLAPGSGRYTELHGSV